LVREGVMDQWVVGLALFAIVYLLARIDGRLETLIKIEHSRDEHEIRYGRGA
jgi:hypothetical protein